MQEIPHGYCHCGCGHKTTIAKTTDTKHGRVKGQPHQYLRGHNTKGVPKTTVDVFWSKVAKGEEDSCWEWQGRRIAHPRGNYGVMMFDGARTGAHRLAWEFTHGPITDGLHVLHKCDNPPCCNPNHLFLGTHQDNVDDREAKGRNKVRRGEANNKTSLTWEQVCEIRRLCSLPDSVQVHVAKAFNTTPTVVNGIVKGKTWLHPR